MNLTFWGVLILYCVPALISLVGFTHIAFWQKRYDSRAIDTVGEYIGHVVLSFCPVMNWVSAFILCVGSGIWTQPLRKFNQ